MQTGNSTFNGEAAKLGKAVDWLLAIAGWPIVYSVNRTYTLAGTLVDFTAMRPWAMLPKSSASEVKGRPESGAQTIGRWSIDVIDKGADASPMQDRHALSHFVSRPAYVLGNRTDLAGGLTAAIGTLTADLSATENVQFTVTGTGFASSGTIYVGQECIKYTGTATTATTTSFNTLTRGFLLTQATSHRGPRFQISAGNVVQIAGAKVYNFMPNVYRRPAFLFKGYQGMADTSAFLLAGGGIVTSDVKDGALVSFDVSATTWEIYVNGAKQLANPTYGWPQLVTVGHLTPNEVNPLSGASSNAGPLFSDPTGVSFGQQSPATGIYTDNYAFRIDSEWMGIGGIASGTIPGVFPSVLIRVRGLNHTTPADHDDGTAVTPAWTNVHFNSNPFLGTEPINLIRQLLMSSLGDGSNGTYDVFEPGIGCGIPQTLVDLTSFSSIRSQADWDPNAALYFMFTEPEPAKKFIEEEICKPFGLYLAVGNDGKIKLVRPKHPQKFYIGATNRVLRWSDSSGRTHDATLTIGVYSASEMATEMQRALNASTSMPDSFAANPFTVTAGAPAGSSGRRFTIALSPSITLVASGDNAWSYLGFTVPLGPAASFTSTDVAAFSGATITQGDLWGLQELDARDMQVTSVVYEYDYDWDRGKYRSQAEMLDAESVNLGDSLGAHKYIIKSKGLTTVKSGVSGRWSGWHGLGIPSSGSCTPPAYPPTSTGVDAYTWSQLTSKSILDRYKVPPLKIRFKLKWGGGVDATGAAVGTRLENGDVFRLNYNIKGVLADRETGLDYASNVDAGGAPLGRLFEVISKTDQHQRGYVDVVALSHRYVSHQ